MSRHKPTHAPADTPPTPDTAQPDDLTLAEEDAYAHIITLAKSQHTQTQGNEDEPDADSGKRRVTDKKRPRQLARGCARRFLIFYYAGLKVRDCLKQAGCDWGDITTARWTDPDYEAAYKWSEDQKVKRLKSAALDLSIRALDGEDIPTYAARLASWILERTDKQLRKPETKALTTSATGGGPAVVYNIVLNAAPAKSCDQNATTQPQPAIDV